MKKLTLALFAISIMAAAALAQGKANYSGTWNLDKEKSTFAGPMRLDGMSLTVAQSAKEIKVDTTTKRLPPNDTPPPAGAPTAGIPGGGPGRGMGGRGMGGGFGMGDGSSTYSLDGKELKVEMDGPNGKMPVIFKGTQEADGSLKLSSSRSFNGPMGEITMVMKENWTLSTDGKTLTVDRESTTPRGAQTSKLVFIKG
ncbi:MAG: hypothetical protein ABIR33_09175 [Pyrinomonadaceae bacterium]